MQGNEPLSTVAVGSDRDTGYTREIKPKGEFTQSDDQVRLVATLIKLLHTNMNLLYNLIFKWSILVTFLSLVYMYIYFTYMPVYIYFSKL